MTMPPNAGNQAEPQYWRRIGLVSTRFRKKVKAYYDFQDLICLKDTQKLVTQGLPPHTDKI